jgi:23S rRNA (cytidine2498-2'-O)-methyltransferase
VLNNFILTSCEAGSERALKAEIAKNHPSLKLAFSRPGFVTFKLPASDNPEDDNHRAPRFQLNAVFARQFAASLGSAMLVDDVIVKAKALVEKTGEKLRLHVWGRGEVGAAATHPLAIGSADVRVKQIRELLLGCEDSESLWLSTNSDIEDNGGGTDDSRDMAKEGEHVFDVIVPTGPFISESLHIGHHIHSTSSASSLMKGHSAWPGGNPKVLLPSDAPSRAYLKIEEALRWSGVNMKGGDTAVEIGSAPGGACYSLLKRGLNVVGIDPCPQDRQHLSIVSMHPKFSHLKMRLSGLKRSQLPAKVEWLLCDANISPHDALPNLTYLICALEKDDQGFLGRIYVSYVHMHMHMYIHMYIDIHVYSLISTQFLFTYHLYMVKKTVKSCNLVLQNELRLEYS